jgi:hypothetical protein
MLSGVRSAQAVCGGGADGIRPGSSIRARSEAIGQVAGNPEVIIGRFLAESQIGVEKSASHSNLSLR